MLAAARRLLTRPGLLSPLARDCLVYGSLSGLAEFTQQSLAGLGRKQQEQQQARHWDWGTVGSYTMLGGAVFGPLCHCWYSEDRSLAYEFVAENKH